MPKFRHSYGPGFSILTNLDAHVPLVVSRSRSGQQRFLTILDRTDRTDRVLLSRRRRFDVAVHAYATGHLVDQRMVRPERAAQHRQGLIEELLTVDR